MAPPPGFADPKSAFQSLYQRATQVAQQLPAHSSRASPQGRALVGVGISALVPHGYKGLARGLVSGLGQTSRSQQADQQHAAVDSLLNEARALAARVTLVSASLHAGGDSNSVLRRLGSNLDNGSPRARAVRLQRALGSLSLADMIYTVDAPRFLEWRTLAKHRSIAVRQEPDLAELLRGLPEVVDRHALEFQAKALGGVPNVSDPLIGALARLSDNGPDDARQGVNALRVALDALIEHLGGKGDWKVIGRRLVPNDQEWKLVASLHHLLSRGSHAGSSHDKAELTLALQLFLAIAPRLAAVKTLGVTS